MGKRAICSRLALASGDHGEDQIFAMSNVFIGRARHVKSHQYGQVGEKLVQFFDVRASPISIGGKHPSTHAIAITAQMSATRGRVSGIMAEETHFVPPDRVMQMGEKPARWSVVSAVTAVSFAQISARRSLSNRRMPTRTVASEGMDLLNKVDREIGDASHA